MNQKKIILGKIGYLNVLPIYFPLEQQIIKNSFEIIEGIPAHLNELASQGKLDISGTSSIEYARNHEKYLLVPDICIGSNGAVMSVLFLSKLPVDKLNGKKIGLTSHSHTSVALLKMYLAEKNIDAKFVTGNVMTMSNNRKIAGILAIGDEALYLRKQSVFPYVLDLGEEWRKWTGLPFVFGVWVVNKKSSKDKKEIIKACKLLIQAKEWGKKRLDMFASIIEKKNILSYEDGLSYFNGLIYDMREKHLQGLNLFYHFLYNYKLIPKIPKIEFIGTW